MDPVTIAVLGIGALVVVAVEAYLKVKEKNNEIKALQSALETYSSTYVFDPCDENIINNVRNYVSMRFGNDFESVFNAYQTLDEKKVFMQEIAAEIAKTMQIDLNSITITSIDDYTRGYTNPDGKSIVINEALLIADPKQAVKTLCHELRHCMQFQAITDNKWGFSPNRIAEWLVSFKRYGESDYYYLAYINTIVEIDANKFAGEVVK